MEKYEKQFESMTFDYNFEELIWGDPFIDNNEIISILIIKSIKKIINKDLLKKLIKSNEFKNYLAKNEDNCTCLYYKDKIVGIITLLKDEIDLLIVKNNYQSKKHLFFLLKYVEKILLKGVTEIKLLSFKDNKIYNELFEKIGWKKIEEVCRNEIIFNRYLKKMEKQHREF